MKKQRIPRKPHKAERLQKRQEHADAFSEGFKMGYEVGYAEGVKASESKLHCVK